MSALLVGLALLSLGVAAVADGTPLAVGSEAQDFGLRSVNVDQGGLDRTLWLSDFVGARAKVPKRLVLLNFFAVWCAPCLAELPALQTLHERYGAAGLQVLSVNFRREGESVEQALRHTVELARKYGVTYPVLFDRYTMRNQRNYVGDNAVLPCNVLVDASGQVVARLQGKDATAAQLERVVSKLMDAAP